MKNNLIKFWEDNKKVLVILFCYTILIFGYFAFSGSINNDGIKDLLLEDGQAGFSLYLSVGRWGWALLGLISGYYPIPIFDLILNACLFSLATIYLCKLLKVENKLYQVLIGMIMIGFPVNAIAYAYGSWQFSIGIGYFVAIYSVYCLYKSKFWYEYFFSSFLIAFSISVYQSFLPFIIVLMLLLFIRQLMLNNSNKLKEYFMMILKCIVLFLLGCFVYVIMTKLTTFIFNIKMSDYQYASSMFKIDFANIIEHFSSSLKITFSIHTIAFFSTIIHITMIVITIFTALIIIFKGKGIKKSIYLLLFILLLIAPEALRFLKPSQFFHSITNIPYVIMYTGSILLFLTTISDIKIKGNKKFNDVVVKISVAITIIIIFSFAINSNKASFMAKRSSEAAFYFVNRLQIRVESLDGYTELGDEKTYFFYLTNNNNKTFYTKSKAYVETVGLTSNFTYFPPDIIDALNVMGINATLLEKKDNDLLVNEILNICRAKHLDIYPSEESIFIYKGVIVIIY